MSRESVAIILLFVVIIIGGLIVVDHIEATCHAQGGTTHFLYGINNICVDNETGRILP